MKVLCPLVGAACLGFISCSPMGGYPGAVNGSATASGATSGAAGFSSGSAGAVGSSASAVSGSTARPTASQLQELRDLRNAQGGGSTGGSSLSVGTPGVSGASDLLLDDSAGNGGVTTPPQVGYRYAMPVPGLDGRVYNPFTNTIVDARGVESGRLIYDETDPANRNSDGSLKSVDQMPHKFRVP